MNYEERPRRCLNGINYPFLPVCRDIGGAITAYGHEIVNDIPHTLGRMQKDTVRRWFVVRIRVTETIPILDPASWIPHLSYYG